MFKDGPTPMQIEERSTAARIRDAAIECFATEGIKGTTARKVAAKADVSPGSVMNHFGSMEGLRAACDRYLLSVTRERKQRAMAAGPNLDMLAAFREGAHPYLLAYLAEVLAGDSADVAQLVDEMVSDAEDYLAQGVESGLLKPSADPHGRAEVMVLWNLGLLAMHHHLDRLLGADLTDPDFADSPGLATYLTPIMEIYGHGAFTDAFMDRAQEAMSTLTTQNPADSRDDAPAKGTSR